MMRDDSKFNSFPEEVYKPESVLSGSQGCPTAITGDKWRHKGKNSSSPCPPGECVGKPWSSPATAATGDIAPSGEDLEKVLLPQAGVWE